MNKRIRGRRSPGEQGPAPLEAARHLTLTVKAGGRVVLPADLRADLGVREGDVLHGKILDGELLIMSRDTAIRHAQQLVRQFVPSGVDLSEQLIRERREEAQRESE